MAQALPEPLSAPTSKLLEMFYSRGGAQAPQPGSTADPDSLRFPSAQPAQTILRSDRLWQIIFGESFSVCQN